MWRQGCWRSVRWLPADDHPRGIKRLKDVLGDPDGDPLGGFPDRVAVEMRIARGRLCLAVTEQPADDRQAFAERERPRGEAVADVVDADVVEPCLRADGPPGRVNVGHVRARLRARHDPGVAGNARQGREHVHRRR